MNTEIFIAIQKNHNQNSEIKLIHSSKRRNYKNWAPLTKKARKEKFLRHVQLLGPRYSYTLFEDGTIYSSYLKRFLKPNKQPGKNPNVVDHFYYRLTLQDFGPNCHQISRLLYFYFKDHEYKNIKDMPRVIFIDHDPRNISLDNLMLVKSRSKNPRRQNIWPKNSVFKEKNKHKDLQAIKVLIWLGVSMIDIGEKYHTSHASVTRFLNRMKISREQIISEVEAMKKKMLHINEKNKEEVFLDICTMYKLTLDEFTQIRILRFSE